MRRARIFWTITIAAVVVAAAHAWALRWTCDDAFISFRYAEHFVEGHGLVFNLDPLEAPVEGYSNFAWTIWLALGMTLGFTGDSIETWSSFWGSVSHAGAVLLLAIAAWRCSGGRAVAPIAACAYAVLHHAASLAPAGLETAMFVMLSVWIVLLSIERRCRRDVWLLSFLCVLVAMTRPDGALWCVLAGSILLVDALRGRAPGDVLIFALPFVLVFVPYLLWRHAYYGYWVPNTFYAKSGGDPYPGQGLFYVVEYFKCYALLLVPVCVCLLALPWRRRIPVRPPRAVPAAGLYAADPWSGPRAGVVLLAFVASYLGFVIWVGGDFMFARFLLPITPIALLAADVLLQRAPRFAAGAALVLTIAAMLRHEPAWLDKIDAENNPYGITDNRAITVAPAFEGLDLTWAELFRGAGHQLRELFDGLDVRIGIAGSHANVAYRSRVPVAVETAAGLTDAHIAHIEVQNRGRVGHERNHSLYPGYLERRGVHFMFELSYKRDNAADPYRDVSLSETLPVPVKMVVYDRELLAELKRRNPALTFPDFEGALDAYIAELANKDPVGDRQQVERDYRAFCEFYFDHNEDEERRAAFRRFLDD